MDQGTGSERDQMKLAVCFPSHELPPARKRAHNSHTRVAGIEIYKGFEAVLLIRSLSGRLTICDCRLGAEMAFPHVFAFLSIETARLAGPVADWR
jgi:hypothetical protein